MANRIIDVFYRLKDLFTDPVGKITAGYRQLGDAAEQSGERVEKSFAGAGKSMDAAVGAVQRLASALGVTVGLGAAVTSFRAFVNEADRLNDLAVTLGTTTEQLSVLEQASSLAGISATELESVLKRLQISSSDAASGTGEAAKAFARLGLDARALVDVDLQEKLRQIADGFASVSSQAERLDLAQAIFGRSGGTDFIRLLQDGAAGFDLATEAAKEFALVIDSDTASAADKLADSLERLQVSLSKMSAKAFAPAIDSTNKFLAEIGETADPVTNLTVQLSQMEAILETMNEQPTFLRSMSSITVVETEILRLKRRLEEIAVAQEAAAEATSKRVGATEEERQAAAQVTAVIDAQVKAYEQGRQNVSAALAQETAELRAAKTEQATVVKEFGDLVKQITGRQVEPSSVQASLLQKQAQAALEQGDIDTALEKARESKQMLLDLAAAGEKGVELGFIAKELEKIATAATTTRVGKELIDVQGATESLNTIKAQIDALKNTVIPVQIRPEIVGGDTLAAAVNAEIARRGGK